MFRTVPDTQPFWPECLRLVLVAMRNDVEDRALTNAGHALNLSDRKSSLVEGLQTTISLALRKPCDRFKADGVKYLARDRKKGFWSGTQLAS